MILEGSSKGGAILGTNFLGNLKKDEFWIIGRLDNNINRVIGLILLSLLFNEISLLTYESRAAIEPIGINILESVQ